MAFISCFGVSFHTWVCFCASLFVAVTTVRLYSVTRGDVVFLLSSLSTFTVLNKLFAKFHLRHCLIILPGFLLLAYYSSVHFFLPFSQFIPASDSELHAVLCWQSWLSWCRHAVRCFCFCFCFYKPYLRKVIILFLLCSKFLIITLPGLCFSEADWSTSCLTVSSLPVWINSFWL